MQSNLAKLLAILLLPNLCHHDFTTTWLVAFGRHKQSSCVRPQPHVTACSVATLWTSFKNCDFYVCFSLDSSLLARSEFVCWVIGIEHLLANLSNRQFSWRPIHKTSKLAVHITLRLCLAVQNRRLSSLMHL